MRRAVLFALLAAAASARLLLQIAAMPPYAGLDEPYHLARLAFVREEHRNPTIVERSIPPYVATSIRGDGAMPAFSEMRERWPAVVRSRGGRVVAARPFSPSDLHPYIVSNYEAQQPSFYYSALAPLGGVSAVRELRVWRLTAALLGLVIVMAAAVFAWPWFGTRGVLAAAMIVSMPTWLTLILRAGNDSLACALAAVAVAITASAPRRALAIAAEALCWAAAVATKLYVWPIGIVAPLFWRMQRAARMRIAVVLAAVLVSAGLTLRDLASRTRNPLGHFGFDPVTPTAAAVPIAWAQMLKITIASFIWTSGQHADALAPFFGGVFLSLVMRRWRILAVWIVGWDILITECALFQDWAGSTSPAHPSVLFRWGPLHAPFTAALDGIGIGPLTSQLVLLRIVHLAALAALFALESILQSPDDNDGYASAPA